jgi:signal transduction histidine kinase
VVDTAMTSYAPAERAEPDALARQAALFGDAGCFGELLQYVPVMVLILNRQRQAVYANRAARDAVATWDLAEVVGRRPGELFACTHALAAEGGCGTTPFCRYCGAVKAILERPQGGSTVEECRITVERGGCLEALDLRVWASGLAVGEEPFTFFAVADIADEKKRLFLERIFLHDILNTAQALRGFAQILGMATVDEATRREFTERIAALGDRIVAEIDSHRLLVAAERGELDVETRTLDARQVLAEVVRTHGHPDLLQRRSLRLADDSASVQFESDPTLLIRVLGNMVKNALEASAPGETVVAGCRGGNGSVTFWIQNPTYMPENIRLQVFKRSFSTKGQGRGLGTYSMKYLTEKYLRGTIGFSTTEAEGTTFRVVYPLAAPAPRP